MKNQKGSAHVVVIILLVVTVLGLLSFVFWQNFLAPKDDKVSSVTTAQMEDTKTGVDSNALTQLKTIQYSGATLSFNYPEDWTISETSKTAGTLTSPDKSLYYDYSLIGLGGIGGTCSDPEDDTFTSIYWGSTSINDDIIFGQYSRKSIGDNAAYYSYGFGLMLDENNSYRNFKVGDTACSIDLRDFLQTGLKNTDGEPVVAIFKGHFKNLDDEDATNAMTQAKIDAAFATETFELAKSIALSANIKS